MSRRRKNKKKKHAFEEPEAIAAPAEVEPVEPAPAPDPIDPDSEKPLYWKFVACAVVLILLVLSRPLLKGGVALYLSAYLGTYPWVAIPEYAELYKTLNIFPFYGHMGYPWDAEALLYPWLHFAATEIADGRMPLWLPFAGCGVPLIGNQQSAVFSPFSIFYFLFKSVYLYNLFGFLKLGTVGVFGFLFSRKIGLSKRAAYYAGAMCILCPTMYGIWSHPHGTAIIFLMPLMWVAEKYLQERSLRSLLNLAAIVAISIAIGAPEASFTTFVASGLYVISRAIFMKGLSWGERFKIVGIFAGVAGVGGASMTAGHLLLAEEYISLSYANAWRGGVGFSWEILTHYVRPFRTTDLLPFVVALTSAVFAFKCFHTLRQRWNQSVNLEKAIQVGFTSGLAVVSLGLFILLGLEEHFVNVIYRIEMPIGYMTLGGIAPLLLAIFAMVREDAPAQQRALAWPCLILALMCVKVFGFSHIVGHLPFLEITTAEYPIFPIPFLLTIVSAFGLERLMQSASWPSARRAREAGLFAITAMMIPVGVYGAFQFRDFAADYVPTGFHPRGEIRDKEGKLHGGLMGGGKIKASGLPTTIRGWVSRDLPVAQVYAGFPPDDLAPVKLRPSGDRYYFKRRMQGKTNSPKAAVVVLRDNRKINLVGSSGIYSSIGEKRWHAGAFAAGIVIIVAGLLLSAHLSWAVAGIWGLGLAQLLAFAYIHIPHTPADRIVPPVPHLQVLEKDKSLFRTGSLEHEKLWRPSANLFYGIQDFRNSDAIDIMRWVHFERAAKSWSLSKDAKERELGYTLFDVANVKYLYSSEEDSVSNDHYDILYATKGFVLNASKSVLPRARLFYDAVSIPDSGLDDNVKGRETLSKFMGWVADPQNDIRRTLVLHDVDDAVRSREKPDPVEFVSNESTRVELKIAPKRSGYVFLADNYYPGWQVFVDGKRRKLLKSTIAFRAVRVEPGETSVVFEYNPKRFLLGGSFAIFACLCWVFLHIRRMKLYPAAAGEFLIGERIVEGTLLFSFSFWTLWAIYRMFVS